MKKSNLNVFNIVTGAIFTLMCFVTIYPFIYAFSYSVSDTILAAQRNVVFYPQGFTLQNYRLILFDTRVLGGLFISVARTVSGTALFVLVTGMCAYSMSKNRLRGRKFLFAFFTIPLYINGGLLPFYVLVHDLGLFNNFLVYILPACFSGFYMFLMKIYLETIPDSMEESAMLDGANDFHIAFRIYAPLALPMIVTIALFIAVTQWNNWFDALLFVSKTRLQPLQLVLQIILRETQIEDILQVFALSNRQTSRINPESYKMAVLIVTVLPIVFVYPFAQKYFVKGMMIGAVKL